MTTQSAAKASRQKRNLELLQRRIIENDIALIKAKRALRNWNHIGVVVGGGIVAFLVVWMVVSFR
jgi:hypothetical protein